MTQSEWGTFYLVRPRTTWTAGHEDVDVVRTYPNGPSDARIAEELLRLAGHDALAGQIVTALDRGNGRDPAILQLAEIRALLDALVGLEARVGQALLEKGGTIRPDQLAGVRERAVLLDLGEDNPAVRLEVSNALARVASLAVALEDALAGGLEILMD